MFPASFHGGPEAIRSACAVSLISRSRIISSSTASFCPDSFTISWPARMTALFKGRDRKGCFQQQSMRSGANMPSHMLGPVDLQS
jgi:hypothetical protein